MGFLGFGRNNEVDLIKKILDKLQDLINVVQRSSATPSSKESIIKKYREAIKELNTFEAEFRRGNVNTERRAQIRTEIDYRENSFVIGKRDITNVWFYNLPENERREIAVIIGELDNITKKLDDKLKQQ